jgi:mRNA interferase HigB
MIHIIKTQPIYEFIKGNPTCKLGLEAWITIVKSCTWQKPSDIVSQFGPKAIDLLGKKDNKPSTVSSNRVVFDVKGNHLRIIAKYQFHPTLAASRLYIKWIGTHAEYTDLCNNNLQYDIDLYK